MSFDSLPVELAEHLALHCKPQDLLRLSRVNHALHAIFNPVLYKHNAAATGLPPCYPWTDKHDPRDCWQCPIDQASRSCLHWAVNHDSLSTIKLAVAYGSDINKINDVADYIRYEEGSETINICGRIIRPQLATPLHLAIFLKRFEIVRWLLENGASTDLWPDTLCTCRKYARDGNRYGWLPLHYAIHHSTYEIFKLLLERDVIYSAICDEGNISGLQCAIVEGSLPAVDAFIQHESFNPTDRDARGQTPLHWVKRCKDQESACAIIEKLAQCGVPLDAKAEHHWSEWHGGTALNMLIAWKRFLPAIKLLQLGADPTVQLHDDGCLQLLGDCIDGHDREDMSKSSLERERAEKRREARLELLSLLIQKGINPGRPRELNRSRDPENLDQDEPRPLLSALLTSDAQCMQILLEAGAMARERIYENNHDDLFRDFVKMTFDGMEQGTSWIEIGHVVESCKESICLLLAGGARIDSRDGQFSALSRACEIEQGFEIVSFLADNATCKNAEAGYVVALRDEYRRDEPVWEKLDCLYYKLMAEENEREGNLEHGEI
ncbi:hypothetical protein F52700_618 [Fusarium sp. NRRL 52700]|nr:hypothetical protein F52700_618 [Fusarium sp. NRRL 52700]